jgi:hypothetical protein
VTRNSNWWQEQRDTLPRHRTALPRKIAATPLGSLSGRDKARAAGASADHAGTANVTDTGAAEALAGRGRRHESGVGRIHYAADVKQTVVLEQIRQEPSTDIDSEHDLPADLPSASAAHVREMLSLALRSP